MADELTVQAVAGPRSFIASPLHTLIVIVFWALNAYVGWIHAAQSRAGMGPSRSGIYVRTMLSEIVFLGIVVIGVRIRGVSLRCVFGERWRSLLDALRDLGLGVLLLIVSTFAGSIIGGHQSGAA